MKLTTEQLNNMADGNWPDSGFFEMIKEMARELLASRVAKPERLLPADSHSVHGAGQSPIAKIGR